MWRVFVADTMTGAVVGDLPFSGNPQWEYGLNLHGSWSVLVPLGGNGISRDDYLQLADPWRFSIGIARGSQILQCGPLVSDRFTDDRGTGNIQMTGAGLWQLLTAKRLLLPSLFTGHDVTANDGSADVNLIDLSLHTIAKRVLEIPMARYGGSLPVVFPADIAGTHTRNYKGYDLGYVGERLSELTEVIDGPEIEFRPEWTDGARRAMRWVMRIGNPNLGNLGRPHAWDYQSALVRIDVDRDASKQTFAHFEKGSGSEYGMIYGHYQDLTLIDAGWPLLEDQGSSHISASTRTTLDDWAERHVKTYFLPTITWDVTIRSGGDDGTGRATRSPSLDVLYVGDTGVAAVRGHRLIRDGDYPIRVIRVANGQDLHTARLTLQPLQGAE